MPLLSRRPGCRAVALTVTAVAVLVLVAFAIADPRLTEYLTAEGGIVEWMQVLMMTAAGALSARHGWLALLAGRPVALDVAIVSAMAMITVGELDLDRALVGMKVISTRFFVNPKYALAWRALAVLVIVGGPVAVGCWLLTRWRQLADTGREQLREPWGQAAAIGVALYALTEIFETKLDHIPWQPQYFIEETLELVAAVWIFVGLAARPGLLVREPRAAAAVLTPSTSHAIPEGQRRR